MARDAKRTGNRRTQMNKGVVELALLAILQERAHYGLELLDRMNGEAGLEVADGTIYPLLHRMETGGFITSEWVIEADQARPRKYYALTPQGRMELKAMAAEWRDLSKRINALVGKD
ncbi:MAG TPA: PadR family transcriptional regulator [Hyphomonas sp.]|nr:PadR family transcriptional regulator [Hyphomonas sp.]HRX74011.1 PadR family transcriptional regulator [Hyphomonas sp.]